MDSKGWGSGVGGQELMGLYLMILSGLNESPHKTTEQHFADLVGPIAHCAYPPVPKNQTHLFLRK